MTNSLTRVRWFCPKCDTMHSLTEPLEEAVETAFQLRAAGILMVALYDETYAIMCDQDTAEERSGLTDLAACRVTMQDTGKTRRGNKVYRLIEPFTFRLGKPRKSP